MFEQLKTCLHARFRATWMSAQSRLLPFTASKKPQTSAHLSPIRGAHPGSNPNTHPKVHGCLLRRRANGGLGSISIFTRNGSNDRDAMAVNIRASVLSVPFIADADAHSTRVERRHRVGCRYSLCAAGRQLSTIDLPLKA